VIRLVETVVRDLVRGQLHTHAIERGDVWDANQYDVGNALPLGVGSGNAAGGVIGLYDLVLNGQVLPDEQVGVAVVDLRHDVSQSSRLQFVCQEGSLVPVEGLEPPRPLGG
jgi:hypothetical protein